MSSSTVYGTTGRRRATNDETVVILAGEQGPAGVSYGFNWGGDWDPSVTYSKDDAVRASDGYLWICIASSSAGIDPTDPGQPDWQRLVGDITAEAISVDPSGGILAENVQDALEELDSEMTDHIVSAEPVHNNYQRRMGFQLDGDGEYGCTLSYDPATRKITLAPPTGASFEYWIDGTKYVNIGALESVAHADVAGGYFFYFDETGQLVVSTTAWDLRKVAPVCYVYYLGSGVGVAYEERHTTLCDTGAHEALHFSVGTFIRGNTGFELSNYALTTDSEAAITPDVAAGDVMDEDIKTAIPAFVAGDGYSVAYKLGPSANDIAIQTGLARPYVFDGGANYIQYNQYTGGAWQLTSVGASNFVIYTLFILPALENEHRRLWVPGEDVYGTLANAKAALGILPDVGVLLSQEFVAVAQIIFRTGSSYATAGRTRIEQVQRIKTTRSQAAAFSPTVHNSLTGRDDADTHPASAITNAPAGTVAATTVQAAINELDTGKVAKAGDTMTGSLILPSGDVVIGDSSSSSRLHVVVGGAGGYKNVRISNKTTAEVGDYNIWRTPLTIYNDFGSAPGAGNAGGVTGVNTGLRIVAGTDNPAAASGTPGADSVIGFTLFSGNGALVDPKNIWAQNNLVHYFRSPDADPASGLIIYGIEQEVIHNTASDHISDPWGSVGANQTRSMAYLAMAHSENLKKVTAAFVVDAGGYNVGSNGRLGLNWWQTGLALTRCSAQGILFDVRAGEVGVAFATAGIYFKSVPAGTNLIRCDLATSSIYLPYNGDVNFNFYNSNDQNLYIGIGAGDGSPVKECGLKLYDGGTLKWSILKSSANYLLVYDNANSVGASWSSGALPAAPGLHHFAKPVAASYYISGSSLNASTYTMQWGLQGFDVSDGNIVRQSSNEQIKVAAAGQYQVGINLFHEYGAGGENDVKISRYNSGGTLQEERVLRQGNDAASTKYRSASLVALFDCAGNDYFKISSSVTAGTAVPYTAESRLGQLHVQRLN